MKPETVEQISRKYQLSVKLSFSILQILYTIDLFLPFWCSTCCSVDSFASSLFLSQFTLYHIFILLPVQRKKKRKKKFILSSIWQAC